MKAETTTDLLVYLVYYSAVFRLKILRNRQLMFLYKYRQISTQDENIKPIRGSNEAFGATKKMCTFFDM